MKRAIYVGKNPINIQVWNQGRQPDYILSYGMTGDYIGNTFIPDDKECPAFNIDPNPNVLYFPRH